MGILQKAYNFISPLGGVVTNNKEKINLNNRISPSPILRLRQDIGMWRTAISEAEQAYYPHRVKMQTIYIDTVLNGHVTACMERRKDLTLLRDYEILDSKGNKVEGLEWLFNAEWFSYFLNYSLDAMFYGYSLIALNDLIDSAFPDITIVKRNHISPDREEVVRYLYAQNGDKFLDEPYKDWHIWVKTPTDNGHSQCGYGLLYNVAPYEIFLRNTLGYNGDFVELYSQPYRIGKTSKTNEDERAELEVALRNMGSSGYAVIDPMDDIQFLETALGGTGWKGYENLEQRCEKKISKIILGHADALDSTSGKLGATQGEDNPIYQAMEDKQSKDGRFIENIVNGKLIPKLRKLGFKIPEGIVFVFANDYETAEVEKKELERNKAYAEIAQVMKNSGIQIDEQYFTEQTGIPCYVNIASIPGIPFNKHKVDIKNKLNDLYK